MLRFSHVQSKAADPPHKVRKRIYGGLLSVIREVVNGRGLNVRDGGPLTAGEHVSVAQFLLGLEGYTADRGLFINCREDFRSQLRNFTKPSLKSRRAK
jgi:hypothetical protein